MLKIVILLALLFLIFQHTSAVGEQDLIKNLPGVIFEYPHKLFSGYLKAGGEDSWHMHYVLAESKSSPSTDPLIVWFNGGPGCSSLFGFFSEIGPFYIHRDNRTLFENIYAWNMKANVLFLESPFDVGFSYADLYKGYNETTRSDDLAAELNVAALGDFFARVQPQYSNRTFYLTGESYAGRFIPMLASRLIDVINSGSFPNPNFQGFAIGNGAMDEKNWYNGQVVWAAYHGWISTQEWDRMKKDCQHDNITDPDRYNYYPHKEDHFSNCVAATHKYFEWYNVYNNHHFCYNGKFEQNQSSKNPATWINHWSTDNQNGMPCWSEHALATYLNREEVQKAMHISAKWKKQRGTWIQCNNVHNDELKLYNKTQTTEPHFHNILDNNKIPNFRILIYNGDADIICEHLGNAFFLRELSENRNMTTYSNAPWLFGGRLAGFVQTFENTPGKPDIRFHFLTVRGAGHMVPTDRPGPALQMINNFMVSMDDTALLYSQPLLDQVPKLSPLKKEYMESLLTEPF